jgi:plastocyanin
LRRLHVNRLGRESVCAGMDRRLLSVLPLVALFALAGCGGTSSGGGGLSGGSTPPTSAGSTGSSSTIAGLAANNHGQADVTGKSSVDVEADNYYFEPSVLKGTPGQTLTLHVKNATSTAHNVTIEAQHIDKDLAGQASEDVKVTLPASGVLAFWCEYHKSYGMVGGLLVSGPVAGSGAPASAPSSSAPAGGYYGGSG